jgi:hypothetical protein
VLEKRAPSARPIEVEEGSLQRQNMSALADKKSNSDFMGESCTTQFKLSLNADKLNYSRLDNSLNSLKNKTWHSLCFYSGIDEQPSGDIP